jgi:hypothetical protein
LYRKGGFVCVGGEKVDALEHFTEELARTTEEVCTLFVTFSHFEVQLLQEEARVKPEFLSFGFVTMASFLSATKAQQVCHPECCQLTVEDGARQNTP